jgi:6,7-dimethyl-8-ribityllumazine synthase
VPARTRARPDPPAIEAMPVTRLAPDVSGDARRVAIVLSRFNPQVGEGLLAGALRGLREAGVAEDSILVVTVPGALEIPLAL